MENNTEYEEISNQWLLENSKLIRSFKFKNFIITFNFMNEIAIVAEEINHHPTWTNTYNKLEIILQTHDTGGLSELDYLLARKIDQLYNQLK